MALINLNKEFYTTFSIKKNDTLPALALEIKTTDCLGSVIPFSLTGTSATTFSMADSCGNIKIASSPSTIIDSSGGTIQYNWQTGDTDTIGRFTGEFQFYFSGGTTMTLPTIGKINIQIFNTIN
jgi:hypothetical protein